MKPAARAIVTVSLVLMGPDKMIVRGVSGFDAAPYRNRLYSCSLVSPSTVFVRVRKISPAPTVSRKQFRRSVFWSKPAFSACCSRTTMPA
jgi:hypothetical protein